MRHGIVSGRSRKPAGRSMRPAGLLLAVLVSLPAAQPALAGSAASADTDRRDVRSVAAPRWFVNGDTRAARALVDLLASSRLDGLDPESFQVDSLAKAVSRVEWGGERKSGDTERKLSAAFVRYVQALHSGAGRGWIIVDKELSPDRETASQILTRAAAAPSLADYVAQMQFMHPAYAKLRRSLDLGTGFEQGRSEALIRLNLARLQMLPGSGRYILVNAAAQRLQMVEDGKIVDEMKVVVGKPKYPTPVMAAYIRYAALNPYWEVPPDLAAERIAPNVVSEGLGYLKSHGYVVLSDWGANPTQVDPSTIDWKAVADGTVQIRVRQNPGPGNAMGRMKFMFPNAQGVYLHDTPDKQLLNEAARLFSGGCVRLQDAPRLSKWMFGETLNPKGAGPDERVNLDKPVPVYIAYLTAMPEGGQISYYDDIYGRDEAALASQSTGEARLATN